MSCYLSRAAVLTLAAAYGARGADFPKAEISNGEIRAIVYLPDAAHGFYRATRFDWSGVIGSLAYRGHEYYGQWFQRVDPKVRDFTYDGSDIVSSPCTAMTGPAEEFVGPGNTTLGYDEAKPGGTFIKIGVGVLRRPDDSAYNRFRNYEIADPGKWTVRAHEDRVEFEHDLLDASTGYGYSYTKVVRLVNGEPVLTLEHKLKNTGRRPIDTSVYDHNFLYLDRQPPGPDFTISVPFAIRSDHPPAAESAEIKGNQILYRKVLQDRDRVATPVDGFGATRSDYDIRIENAKLGAGMRITGDRPLLSESLWSIRAVLAMEPFLKIDIAPGREYTWTIEYRYYTLPAAHN
ncbi:MAG TPA: hypothetical protein VMH81_22450 [Bryobacteraceae bacterium]|nr:hypothetical protein [Bryobacteraceae bacterium]